MTSASQRLAYVAAGIPATQSIIYWRIGFSVGDQVVLLELPKDGGFESVLILRDIEMDRARQFARVDRVACPADFAPAGGLSGDRETANAQAAGQPGKFLLKVQNTTGQPPLESLTVRASRPLCSVWQRLHSRSLRRP